VADDTFTDLNGFVRLSGDFTGLGLGVSSVFTRTGDVVAANGDYSGVVATHLTGATAATRYVGGTASGAPGSGAFLLGDFVVAQNGHIFVCTVAGSPGTWVDAGSVANQVTSVFTRTGAVVATAGDYTGIAVGGTADALATGALTNAMVNAAAALAVSKLAPGLAGQVLQGVTPSYAYPPGFEITYDQITSTVNIVATSEGTPTGVITGTSKTYENVPYLFHFHAPVAVDSSAASGTLTVLLMQDSSSIGRIAVLDSVTVSTQVQSPITGELRFTPSAGAHTYGVSAFVSSTTGTPSVGAGAGGSGVIVPAFLRVTKA
jgi:hypothetical protein